MMKRNKSFDLLVATLSLLVAMAQGSRQPLPNLLQQASNNATKSSLRRGIVKQSIQRTRRETRNVRHSYDYSPQEIMPMLSPKALEEYLYLGCDDLASSKFSIAPCKCRVLSATPFDQDAIVIQNRRQEEIITDAPCVDGLSAGKWPCLQVDLKANLPLSVLSTSDDLALFESLDLWGWTDKKSGREFAIVNLSDGLGFVEVTDPVDPIYWGKLVLDVPVTYWGDVKVYKNHAFAVMEKPTTIGMVVFDLTQLLSPTLQPRTIFEIDASYNGAEYAHNIVINEESGYAYIVGSDTCEGGLHMVDIRNPKKPVYAGCYNDLQPDDEDKGGYTHDAQCVIYQGPDSYLVGQEICFCCNLDTVTIVDVTDKSNPIELSRTPYPYDKYTHQGWLSPDHRYFVYGDELDELEFEFNTRTMVLDVSDLGAPTNYQEFYGPTKAIDHNQYIVKGEGNRDFTFQANYRAGLQAYEILDYETANFDLVGFFDIYPADDDADFNGAWTAYPYFPSGTVVVSGIAEGLFVLQPTFDGAIGRKKGKGKKGGMMKGKGKGKGGMMGMMGMMRKGKGGMMGMA